MALYGIDLGTTYCAAAWLDGAEPRIVALDGTATTRSSIVALQETDGEVRAWVGAGARARDRERTLLIRGAKNYTGVRETVIGGPPWIVAGRALYATDILALQLRAIAQAVRDQPSLPPMERVVVSHPQRFRNGEKLAVGQAARLAGLELVAMITEPDAAAWAYGLYDRRDAPGKFLVFDFGGGTLDVTLMERRAPVGGRVAMHAVGSYGVQLGGLQIDEAIVRGVLEKYGAAIGEPVDDLDDTSRESLLDLAESLKIDLNRAASDDPSPLSRTRGRSVRLVTSEGRPLPEVRLKVSLGEVSSWIEGDIERALACAEQCLSRCGTRWDDVHEVLLTGGSSQLWALQRKLRERAGGRVSSVIDDGEHPLRPSTVVAVGAAIYGASLERGISSAPAIDVRGVVPDRFAVRAFRVDTSVPIGRRAVLHTLVAAGTPTPFVGSAEFRMRGAGSVLPIEVFEGEGDEDATPIGTFRIEFDHEVPDGAAVRVQLRVEANGALALAVHEAGQSAAREVPLLDAPGLYSESEIAERRTFLQAVRLDGT